MLLTTYVFVRVECALRPLEGVASFVSAGVSVHCVPVIAPLLKTRHRVLVECVFLEVMSSEAVSVVFLITVTFSGPSQ